MSLERDLWRFLAEHPALADEVGGRVYALTPPDDVVYPCLVYQVTDGENFDSNEGEGELNQKSVTLHALAEDYHRMKDLLALCRRLLAGYAGGMGGTSVHYIDPGRERPDEIETFLGAAAGVYHQAIELAIFYYT